MNIYSKTKPILVLATGVPGSGKTALYRKFHSQLPPFVYLDKDDINEAFSGDDRSSEHYLNHVRRQSYQLLALQAERNLGYGNNVWVDSPNPGSYLTEKIQELGASVMVRVIRCVAPAEIIRQRIIARGSPRDDAKLNDWENQLLVQPIHIELPDYGREIDTTLPDSQQLAILKTAIYSDRE